VAIAGDDPARQHLLKRTVTHLRDITTMIVGKVEGLLAKETKYMTQY